jgi:uncharacterized Zn finger protein (UPF0148 family)
MTENLRNCPFCGSEKIAAAGGTIFCHGCHLRLDIMTPEEWNHRPLESALEARVKELEADLAQARAADEKLAGLVGQSDVCVRPCPILTCVHCLEGGNCSEDILKWAYAPAEVEG